MFMTPKTAKHTNQYVAHSGKSCYAASCNGIPRSCSFLYIFLFSRHGGTKTVINVAVCPCELSMGFSYTGRVSDDEAMEFL